MASSLKKEQSMIESIDWYWCVINGRKCMRGGIYHSIHRYAKANDKYIKDYDKNKTSLCYNYWDISNLYRWTMLQRLSLDSLN